MSRFMVWHCRSCAELFLHPVEAVAVVGFFFSEDLRREFAADDRRRLFGRICLHTLHCRVEVGGFALGESREEALREARHA